MTLQSGSNKRPKAVLLALVLAVALPACSSVEQAGGDGSKASVTGGADGAGGAHAAHTAIAPATPAASTTAANAGDVRIGLFQFAPTTVRTRVGAPVTWANSDQIEHSVTHGTPAAPGAAFDSGLFVQGQRFTFTFSAPGEYAYFCTRHPSMEGVVQVTG